MLQLPASVRAEDAGAVRTALAEALGRDGEPEVVVVDASGLQRFDSAALAVLIDCERRAAAAGKRFSVRGLPAQLASLATLYGVDALLRLEPQPQPVVAAGPPNL